MRRALGATSPWSSDARRAIARLLASPLTTPSCTKGNGRSGFPSMRTRPGAAEPFAAKSPSCSARGSSQWLGHAVSSARRIAKRVAPRILCRSISSTLAVPLEAMRRLASHSASTMRKSRSRRVGESCLESFTPSHFSRKRRSSNQLRETNTLAATTGPASAPRPASSTPASHPFSGRRRRSNLRSASMPPACYRRRTNFGFSGTGKPSTS